MSQIERFNKDLSTNKEMLEEVKALGNDLDKIVAYANSKGYNFTVEDIKAKQGELSEQDLDKVAGGGGGILIAW
ncbi:MAG: Nif11-like leader peptide family RiPP precursor [Bacillota bacterium]|mgnify:CR=1 FL=1|jgi:predicted ribosomally synthesized peptide with nif11-like leader|nr:Nif11-like leader peptide family RiPP precursor [Bacillota bacterium]NLV64281.1 Nif11-like leader peptide family natural product precursor [Clostridiaceae bacterium]